ncbi:hypothetical protein IWQ60_010738 [Tieghemiomyces parasiticus]|uniref:XPG-I domain-containing protein n=1 Tax=Tieghemiomyces parasiticus TaxID=78921 RepID=A0A9W7ZIZ2_9FUNG|nr:hypothetical protein IWQ60_010738 [Tieghemiomyces parasiticus]
MNQPTDKFVTYCMFFVNMLRHHDIKPILVFDGGALPSKQCTEDDRQRKRDAALARATQLMRGGHRREAAEAFQKCLDITPEIAHQFIKRLRQEKVDYIVAPYEADAQLYYLDKAGLVDAVITEDSDLLAFGCRRIIFKLDRSGCGVEIRGADLSKVRDGKAGLDLTQWSLDRFRQMCILSGCDYLPSIPRIGIKTAYQLLKKHGHIKAVLKTLRQEGKFEVPPAYEAEFRRAELTFMHQRVYDPFRGVVTPLNALPDGADEAEMDYIGRALDKELAMGIASGDINPSPKTTAVVTEVSVTQTRLTLATPARAAMVSRTSAKTSVTIDLRESPPPSPVPSPAPRPTQPATMSSEIVTVTADRSRFFGRNPSSLTTLAADTISNLSGGCTGGDKSHVRTGSFVASSQDTLVADDPASQPTASQGSLTGGGSGFSWSQSSTSTLVNSRPPSRTSSSFFDLTGNGFQLDHRTNDTTKDFLPVYHMPFPGARRTAAVASGNKRRLSGGVVMGTTGIRLFDYDDDDEVRDDDVEKAAPSSPLLSPRLCAAGRLAPTVFPLPLTASPDKMKRPRCSD